MATRQKNPTKKPNGAERLIRNGILPGNPGNSGGKPGRSGRPRNSFKKFCRELAASPKYQKALEDASTDAKHENFIGAAKLVATFATTKPPKTIKHVHTTSARDRLADRIARLAERN